MSALYLLQYFAVGALFPLWSLYYRELGLSGTAIGLLVSVVPVAGIVMPPVWGVLSDRLHVHRFLLLLSSLGAGLAALAVTHAHGLAALFVVATILAVFQSAWTPIGDSIALAIAHRGEASFGGMRLWGSVGFAVATLLAGAAADRWGLAVIFPLFALAALAALPLVPGLPAAVGRPGPAEEGEWRGLLAQPAFLWLLLATFAVTGGIASNNYYFAMLYQGSGGSLGGVGLAFLLFAGSEVPTMLGAQRLTDALGAGAVLFWASVLAGLRWFLYSLPLRPWQLLATFPLQGLSGGLFIAVAPMLIARLTPRNLTATALALYGVAGFGFGAIFTATIGGRLLDGRGVTAIYLFLALLGLVGIAAMAVVWRLEGRRGDRERGAQRRRTEPSAQ